MRKHLWAHAAILAGCAIVALVSCERAFAQDGAHGHPAIEAQVDAHTAAIDAMRSETEALAEEVRQNDRDLALGILDLERRVLALEEALGSVEPPVPPQPVPALALYLINTDANTATPIEATSISVSPPFTICARSESEDAPLTTPITFTYAGRTKTENVAEWCANGGDGNPVTPYVPMDLAPGDYTLTARDANGVSASVAFTVVDDSSSGGGGDPGPAPAFNGGMQLGLGGPWSPYIMESPLIDLSQVWGGFTAIDAQNTLPAKPYTELWSEGFIDKTTGLPLAMPDGYEIMRGGLFRYGAKFFPDYYAGDYILEWEGDAEVRFGFDMCVHPALKDRCIAESANRKRGVFLPNDKGWMNVEISRIGEGGLKSLALYRAEDEALFKAGETFAPDFLAHACRYDVLRGMDVTYPMKNSTRSVDQMTPQAFELWGMNGLYRSEAPDMPLGTPMQPLFDLAAQCGNALWYNVAGPIGAGPEFDAYSFEEGNPDGTALRALSRANWQAIIASPEWDRYADALVASLIYSGYDPAELFIIEIGNEIWNYAHPFWWQTEYYAGIGLGFGQEGWAMHYSTGQGVAAARFAEAFAAALERAGVTQNWTMAIAGQAAWEIPAKSALHAYRDYFVRKGVDPAPWMQKAGVTVASYYGGALFADRGVIQKEPGETNEAWAQRWLDAIQADPVGLGERLRDWYFAPDPIDANFAWIKQRREVHRQVAAEYGAYFLGDYEGGSHESHGIISYLRDDPVFAEWLINWRNGPNGEAVNRGWLDAMALDDPDALIANFASIGAVTLEARQPSGEKLVEAPWIDNFYGEENGFTRAIDPFLRPVE